MKHKVLAGILAGVLGLGIPALLESRLPSPSPHSVGAQASGPPEATAPSEAPVLVEATEAPSLPPTDGCILLDILKEDGTVMQLPMDEYLGGVLLAEMPAAFPLEAQKAQAVVARTYALRQRVLGGKHENADLCTDPSCCQAWIRYEDYAAKEGADTAKTAADQAAQAVHSTDGQALFYEGALIDATYFSSSGGRTEAAVEVWGSDVPYLQSVDSPGEEDALHDGETKSFSAAELQDLLQVIRPEAALSGPVQDWFGDVTETEGGGVDKMEIGGAAFSGLELRSLLGLRSTVFSVSVEGDTVSFTTHGNGHRVGMSQYGAKAMAESGSDYREILAHYYPGTELAAAGT